uniref:Uncharacterized protein n=1 Tax=Cacopsylla melanoneura TaxID=428564 RepID=A0A8D9BIP1_9HEMI
MKPDPNEMFQTQAAGVKVSQTGLESAIGSNGSDVNRMFCNTDPEQHEMFVKEIVNQATDTTPSENQNNQEFEEFLKNFSISGDGKNVLDSEKYVKYLELLDAYPPP